jgi:hypothetical protein
MTAAVTEYLAKAFCFVYVINSSNAGGVQPDRVSFFKVISSVIWPVRKVKPKMRSWHPVIVKVGMSFHTVFPSKSLLFPSYVPLIKLQLEIHACGNPSPCQQNHYILQQVFEMVVLVTRSIYSFYIFLNWKKKRSEMITFHLQNYHFPKYIRYVHMSSCVIWT